jgi:hypothetical protein
MFGNDHNKSQKEIFRKELENPRVAPSHNWANPETYLAVDDSIVDWESILLTVYGIMIAEYSRDEPPRFYIIRGG